MHRRDLCSKALTALIILGLWIGAPAVMADPLLFTSVHSLDSPAPEAHAIAHDELLRSSTPIAILLSAGFVLLVGWKRKPPRPPSGPAIARL